VTTFDPAAFPPVPHGHQYEDFEIGQVFDHHWGRTFTEGDNSFFTTATLAFNPRYTNAELARSEGHPRELVNPMLLLCTVVGLSVEDLSEGGGPFLGVNECEFGVPVHPGDTVTARSTVLDKRESSSRPREGIVTWRTEAYNQRGELVLSYTRTNLSAKREVPPS